MLLRNERPQRDAGGFWWTKYQSFRADLQASDELFEYRTLYIDALGAQTDLPGILERRPGDARQDSCHPVRTRPDARP